MDLARGGVDSMQRQGIAQLRRWVLSGYRANVLPGCDIVMWPERGVAKHGRSRGFGRLPVYRVVLLLSLKISNAALLKLVFRYNGRREFVEEQARSPL